MKNVKCKRGIGYFILLSIWVIGMHSLKAQAPYLGGEGSGYAQVSLASTTVSVESDWHKHLMVRFEQNAKVLNLVIESSLGQTFQMELVDLQGRSLGHWAIRSTRMTIPLSDLSTGVYLLQFRAPQGTYQRKLLLP